MATYDGFEGDLSGGPACALLWTYRARFSRVITDTTGFSHRGRNRHQGLYDCEGSAGGKPASGSTNSPLVHLDNAAATLTLFANQATDTNDCSIAMSVIYSDVDMLADKRGDAGITFDFKLSSTVTAGTPWTATWQA